MQLAITDLADYNEGTLRFKWVDLDDFTDKDDLLVWVNEFLNEVEGADHEEWFVSDYEGPSFGEYPDLDKLFAFKELADDFNEEAATAYVEYIGVDDLDDFEEAYCGEWRSEREYAENLIDDLGYLDEMPDHLQMYFDYGAFTRDLFMSDYHFENGHVFRVM